MSEFISCNKNDLTDARSPMNYVSDPAPPSSSRISKVSAAFSRQAKLRLEMEMERLRHTHSKEIDSKDEEVEEIRQSCSKKVRSFSSDAQIYSLIRALENNVQH